MPTHGLIIDDWHPCRLNKLVGCHWATAARRKRSDRHMVGVYAKIARLPKATGPRRIRLRIVLAPGQRAGDPDAYWKSLLDALVHVGLLLDDNRQHVELAPVAFGRADKRRTEIILEDI